MPVSTKNLGESLAQHLGIELRAPRTLPSAGPTGPERPASELLAEYVGIPIRAPRPTSAESEHPADGPPIRMSARYDRAITIADRVARDTNRPLTNEERTFLWSDRELADAYLARVNLERAVVAAERKAP